MKKDKRMLLNLLIIYQMDILTKTVLFLKIYLTNNFDTGWKLSRGSSFDAEDWV